MNYEFVTTINDALYSYKFCSFYISKDLETFFSKLEKYILNRIKYENDFTILCDGIPYYKKDNLWNEYLSIDTSSNKNQLFLYNSDLKKIKQSIFINSKPRDIQQVFYTSNQIACIFTEKSNNIDNIDKIINSLISKETNHHNYEKLMQSWLQPINASISSMSNYTINKKLLYSNYESIVEQYRQQYIEKSNLYYDQKIKFDLDKLDLNELYGKL